MNYAELVTAVQDYAVNDDATFVANIPNFVKAAEKRIYNAAELPVKSFRATASLTAANRFLTMPDGFLDVQGLTRSGVGGTGAQEYLLQKEVSFIRECYPNPATTGAPKVFAIFDQTSLILGPTPDVAYGVELHYTAFPESIVTATNTWLGDEHANTLLYGTLVEAYTFMKGDEDMLKQYASLLSDGVAALRKFAGEDTQIDYYRLGKPQGVPQ